MAPEGKVNSVYPADLQLETMKVIILGKANIGKTSLTRRYVYNEFTARQGTVGSSQSPVGLELVLTMS